MARKPLRQRVLAGETVLGSMIFELFAPAIPQLLVHAGAEFGCVLDRVQPRLEEIRGVPGTRIRLDEPQGTYEAIQRDFLRQALDAPNDQAIISMWLFCLELVTSGVNDVEAERFEKLFASVTADVD